MKKSYIGIIILVIAVIWSISSYNSIVGLRVDTETTWAKVETSYQRRADLIPNLVSTVKGYADFEKSTLTQVVQARANATSINVNAEDLNPEAISKFQAAQNQLSGALSRLLVTIERYPDLKANRNFLELQAQLEGTENRISVARNRYNEAVGNYNKKIERFPGVLYAGMFNFERKGMFESDAGAEKAPKVEF